MTLHDRIIAAVSLWPPHLIMDWDELAAVLEYDQHNDRQTAEMLAYWQIRRRRQS